MACSAWQLVTSSSSLETRFQALVLQLAGAAGPLDLVTQFSCDYRLQAGQLRESLQDVRQLVARCGGAPEPWHHLKLATVHHCLGDRRSAAQHLVDCVQGVAGGEAGAATGETRLTWATARSRHLRFLPLSRPGVLAYSCKLLSLLLQEKALQHNSGVAIVVAEG